MSDDVRYAAAAFVAELERLEGRQRRLLEKAGTPDPEWTLAGADLDYCARVDEIKLRLESALVDTSSPTGRPSLPALNQAGAHLVALAAAVVDAAMTDVAASDEDVAA